MVSLFWVLLHLCQLFSKSSNCPHVADPLFCQLGDAEQLQSIRIAWPLAVITLTIEQWIQLSNDYCPRLSFISAIKHAMKPHWKETWPLTCVASANASCVRLDMDRMNLPKITARQAIGGTTISTKAVRLGDTYNWGRERESSRVALVSDNKQMHLWIQTVYQNYCIPQ